MYARREAEAQAGVFRIAVGKASHKARLLRANPLAYFAVDRGPATGDAKALLEYTGTDRDSYADENCATPPGIRRPGVDPATRRSTYWRAGTHGGRMMNSTPQKEHQWLRDDGALDGAERALTLETEGPHIVDPGKMARYRDVLEFKSDGHRVLTSRVLGDDGTWQAFMTANDRRKR